MNKMRRCTVSVALTALGLAGMPAAAETEGPRPDERVLVAGKSLRLNGTGVKARLLFKIYSISLYLTEPRKTTEDVLSVEGPRRIAIVMLRDVSGEDFGHALAESASDSGEGRSRGDASAEVMKVAMRISERISGFRERDRLTLDWVPGVGATIDLNRRALVDPIDDRNFYNALLKVWLGEKPVDPRLKAQLLGASA